MRTPRRLGMARVSGSRRADERPLSGCRPSCSSDRSPAGTSRVNVLPLPSVLSTRSCPPSRPAIWAVIASPNPVPPNLPRSRSIRLDERLERAAAALPPGCRSPYRPPGSPRPAALGLPSGSSETTIADPAVLRELDGVAHQVDQGLPQAKSIGDDVSGMFAAEFDPQGNAALHGAGSHHACHVADQVRRCCTAPVPATPCPPRSSTGPGCR